jgi:hypothetical protein
MARLLTVFFCSLLFVVLPAGAQYSPYFVTYDHHMEEPGNLEITTQSTVGIQKHDLPTYWAPLVELEYGATGWWSTSLYLEGAGQPNDATVFTGFRFENRFKPLKTEHRINPVLYFEFENINEASRIQKEVVGHSELTDEPLSSLRGEKARELEGKLILSSNLKNWNIAENFIVEKNFTEDEGVEFGYALGIYRPLATIASGNPCRFCRENFTAGLELYGGLGSTEQFGFRDTAHYIAPAIAWRVSENSTLRFSPGFGLTASSARNLLRFSYTYEIPGFGDAVRSMFRGGK